MQWFLMTEQKEWDEVPHLSHPQAAQKFLHMAIISASAEHLDSWLQIYSNLKNT